MLKYVLLACASLSLMACTPKNEQYYRQNPQALQLAIKNCADKSPSHLSCEQLTKIAENLNQIASELQRSPQGFGKKILKLQEEIEQQELQLTTTENPTLLKKEIARNQTTLAEYLAVVKWLESPER